MIGGMLGRINTAERMTVEQLQSAMEQGSLPAYIGVPILQEKLQMRDRATAIAMGQELAQQPPIIDEIMQQARSAPNVADTIQGIDKLPVQIDPSVGMARGGIVAFANGGLSEKERYEQLKRQELEKVRKLRDRGYYDITGRVAEQDPQRVAKRAADRRYLFAAPAYVGDVIQQPAAAALNAAQYLGSGIANTAGSVVNALTNRDLLPTDLGIAHEFSYTPFSQMVGTAGDTPVQNVQVEDTQTKDVKDTQTKDTKGIQTEQAKGGQGITALPVANVPTSAVGERAPVAELPQPTEPSPMQQYIDMLMQEREAAKGGKDEDMRMAMIQAGLAMMAGQSPNALENIGQGALVGVQSYKDARSQADKQSRESLREAAGIQMQMEQMGANKEYKDAMLELRKADLELKQQQLSIMAAKAAVAASGSGFNPKDLASVAANVFKALVGDNAASVGGADMGALSDQAIAIAKNMLGQQAAQGEGGGPQPTRGVISGSLADELQKLSAGN